MKKWVSAISKNLVLPKSLKYLALEHIVYRGNIFENFIYLSFDGPLPSSGGGPGGGASLRGKKGNMVFF